MLRHARRPALALGLALAACLLTPHPVQAHEPHLELAEVAWTSDVVMLGTVRDIRVYESTRTAAILTDITFADVEVVHASERAAAVGDEVTLTFLGGVLADGRGLSVCDQPHFTRGERWMLFALHDGTRYMNPFVGGPQGMFRIVTDAATGESYPVTAGGSAVVSVDQGALRGTPEVISIDHGIAVCAAPEREHSVTPVAMEGALSASTRRVETEYLPLTLTEFRREVEGILAGAPPETRIFPGRDAEPVAENLKARRPVKSSRTASPEHAGAHEPRGTLCACGYHDLYIVMEQVNNSWWSFPENNQGMFMWNEYIDIYRYVNDDGSWGDNGDNEFGGFPTNQDLADTWESSWGTAIAKTFVRFYDVCGEFEQADVVFNPAYTFVTELSQSLENTGVVHYQQVVMHELGHAWGYLTNLGGCNEDYSYSTHSVMHAYYNSIVENGRGIHAGDAYLVRANYFPAGLLGVVDDLGVESYYVNSNAYDIARTDRDDGSSMDPTVYHMGAPITLENVSLENMGIGTLFNVRARVFFSADQTITNSDYKSPGYFYWDQFSPESWWTGDLTTTVPESMPAGDYWVGVIVTEDGANYEVDGIPQNNKTFLTRKVRVNPPPPSNDDCTSPIEVISGVTPIDTSYAYTGGNGTACGTIYNDVWFRYTPPCNGRITVRTCNNLTFDTRIAIYEDNGNCTTAPALDCNDDHFSCTGGGSRVLQTIVEDQPYLIRVGGASEGEYGTVDLEILLTGVVPNDFCAGALDVAPGGVYEVDNRCASTDGNSESCVGGQVYNDLWYRVQPGCDGRLVASTCNSADFDTRIVIYLAAGSCPGSILYACNDNRDEVCGGGTSSAVAEVSGGRYYWVRVGGATDLERGEAFMSLDCYLDCGDVDGSGMVDFSDLEEMLENWQMQVPPGEMGDVDGSGFINFNDLNILLDSWGTNC